jgi:mannose-1-phosphate guanylyltransferase/mannose-6-phosphate isomerase
VVTDDAVLVANKNRSQEVKSIVESLETNNVPQSSQHRKDHRPWGNFESLNLESNYQLKKLRVKPGGKLSLQSHQFRSEHWVVVKGRATVVIDSNKFYLQENQSTYIAQGQKHSLANDTDDWLTIIEVQVGSYLGEDDIVRYEDIYNRDLNNSR